MPTAPTLGLQVRPQAPPDVRQSPNAPSAAFPGAVNTQTDLSGPIQQVGQLAADQRREEEKAAAEADQIAVADADAQAVRAKTDALWNPQTGAMNARGKDAIPASDAANGRFRDATDQIEQTLSNERQKMAFRRRIDMHYADLGNQLGQHVSAQIKQYDHDTTQGHIEALHDAAVKGYDDPVTVQRSIDDTVASATDFYRRNGHGEGDGIDDYAKHEIAQNVSAIRASVFDQLSSSGRDTEAAQYFTDHKDEFVGHDLVVAEKIAKAGTERAFAQTETTRILTDHPASLTDAMAEAEKIEEPARQDDVKRRIRQHYADQASDLLHARQQNYQSASKILEESGGDFDAVPLKLREALLPGENHALQLRADQIRHPRQFGDSGAYYRALNLAHISDESRTEFAKENFVNGDAYKGLSDQQRSHLLTLQSQVHAQLAKHAGTAPGGSPAAPNIGGSPIAPAKPYNPLAGIATVGPPMTKTPTPAMLTDVQAKGPDYATYLRGLGYKIP